MPEDIGKELLMLGGTLAGFIAALLITGPVAILFYLVTGLLAADR